MIAEAISRVDNFDPKIRLIGVNSDEYPMKFSFWKMKHFFHREDPSKINLAAFLECIWNLFIGNSISQYQFMKRFFVNLKGQLYKASSGSPTIPLNREMVKFIPILRLFQELNQFVYKK